MERTSHGGQCCGINHIRGFGWNGPTSGLVRELKRRQGQPGLLLEAVLSQRQISVKSTATEGKTWADVLMEEGWVLVNRAINPRHGSTINIFHRYGKSKPRGKEFPHNTTDRV